MTNEMKTVLEHSYKGKEIIAYIGELEASETSLGNDLQEALDRWNEWRNKCLKLEKALDKACRLLEQHVSKTVYDARKYGEFDYPVPINTKDEWRKNLLDEVNE